MSCLDSMTDTIKAPVGLFIKMHSALVAKNYSTALNYCDAILDHEQENETIKSFQTLLKKKIEMIDEMTEYTDSSEFTSSESESETETDT
ncbi:uncharacterized protein LOC126840541 [Adelges cooleyi]|uniref:uncharacterized protein LOC126840541 n=1 Tax=Adelges cooleyi TaxID=133065 RepID=UPI0021805901|nr:uncharacterized protein LOC126840541 [Adelges cooleyi]